VSQLRGQVISGTSTYEVRHLIRVLNDFQASVHHTDYMRHFVTLETTLNDFHSSLKHTCQSSKLTTMFSACSSSGLSRSSSSGVETSKIVATLLFCASKISFSLAKRGQMTAMAVLPSWPKFQIL